MALYRDYYHYYYYYYCYCYYYYYYYYYYDYYSFGNNACLFYTIFYCISSKRMTFFQSK